MNWFDNHHYFTWAWRQVFYIDLIPISYISSKFLGFEWEPKKISISVRPFFHIYGNCVLYLCLVVSEYEMECLQCQCNLIFPNEMRVLTKRRQVKCVVCSTYMSNYVHIILTLLYQLCTFIFILIVWVENEIQKLVL